MNKLFILLLISALGFSSCKETEVPPAKDGIEYQELEITINHKANSEDIEYLTGEYTLAAGTVVKPSRLSYLLSNFYLINTNDEKVELSDQYALVDARKGETTFTLKNVPKGEYKAIGYSLGLDSAVNHGDPNQYSVDHPLSSVNNALHWNWTAGYIFIAIEGKVSSSNDSYVYHIAGSHNKVDYELSQNFEKKDAALTATINFNYEEIFSNPNTYDMETQGMTTHSTTGPVTSALVQNLANVFEIISIE